jgi:hypothetical protein
VTPDGYRAMIKAMGLTPCKPSFAGRTLHKGPDGPHDFQQVPDPEPLAPEERAGAIALIKMLRGIRDN